MQWDFELTSLMGGVLWWCNNEIFLIFILINKWYYYLQETLDFVAYVAKDDQDYRACYVLECARGMAQEVITTVGQAFNLRFKDYLKSPDAK